ncbi:unnamed protein product [Cuscuta campestris]|uniref:Uncharacterized protein n=1 Tax=Cuscuta campestris TaxID=132261 RepID=A0A484LBS5_9ASTE|nr:unnamed protein product [Cuscuta campestris]
MSHMQECKSRLKNPYGMMLTHIVAHHGILEPRPFCVHYLDAECLGYCGLVKIGETYYMKREFQDLHTDT